MSDEPQTFRPEAEVKAEALREAVAGIRAEDWWTPEGGSGYEIGDNDGKARIAGWLEDRAAGLEAGPEPQPEAPAMDRDVLAGAILRAHMDLAVAKVVDSPAGFAYRFADAILAAVKEAGS